MPLEEKAMEAVDHNASSTAPSFSKDSKQKDTELDGEATHEEAVSGNLGYNDDELEPEIHARTYYALAAMVLLNMVLVLALQGPPAALDYIGEDLNNPNKQTWVPNALSLVQAVIGPVISSASDLFQARKSILVGACVLSFIGAAIAPGSKDIYRVIAAQTLIGFGFATVPLAYSVPSEILPRRWRPMAQSAMNVAAALGACLGPIVIGALTEDNKKTGWRNFYWFQMALWGIIVIGIWVGYQPPKRHTRLDHLSFWQKLAKLDLIGAGLLTAGLTLLLVGLNLGSGTDPWTSTQVLTTLIIGIVTLIIFGVYEWKGTQTGILNHDLFKGGKDQGRTFSICVGLIFIEGILLFAYILFYPVMTSSLFETDPLKQVARLQPFWIACGLSTMVYGYASTKLRSIRSPLVAGVVIYTAGLVGLATIEPDNSTRAIVFAGLAGMGFGAPLILLVAGVQLSTPHHLIATATAATTSARAVAATVFTAIYSAALSSRLAKYIPQYVSQAVLRTGLSPEAVGPFIEALTSHNSTALNQVPGVNPAIVTAGSEALAQSYADGLRVVYIIAASFGAFACLICFLLGDMKNTMNYHVDAPVEKLLAKGDTKEDRV
ncbi:uncharacterized protein PFLUO_LOCUS105 [Penicillium psychrofluorescens]|uniref:uncharacterized protein n=1 Tax=Penicillium psychrofluorescens TaxID=3158075 RepID=UPI003CCCC5E9